MLLIRKSHLVGLDLTLLYNHEIPNVSRVGYLSVIDAPPTEYSTINTILIRSKEIADKSELKYAVLVFDEAVYAKVQHVCWKEEASGLLFGSESSIPS